jgi:hypothetical protein
MTAPAHAPLSPSARHRWQLCPASVREALKYPERKSGPSAIDGTHTHSLLTCCIHGGTNPMDILGLELTDHEGSFVVDKERAERVSFALAYIYQRKGELNAEIYSEMPVDVYPLIERKDMGGTVDVLLVGEDTLEVIDYKDGVQEVSAVNNPQLRQYALAALVSLPVQQYEKIINVRMTIIQPKLAEWGKQSISHDESIASEFVREEVTALTAEGLAVDRHDAPYVPGEVQCKWCPHAGNCGARAEEVMSKMGVKFGPVQVIEQVGVKDVKDLSDEKLREIIEALPLLRGFLESVEETALERIQSGKPIEGLKIVRGRGTRSWALPDEDVAVKLSKMSVPKNEIWVTKIISPAQLEKLKWQNRKGEAKQLSPKQLEVVQKDFIKKSDGKLTVVSAADERPAVDFGNVEQMFGSTEDALPDWMK